MQPTRTQKGFTTKRGVNYSVKEYITYEEAEATFAIEDKLQKSNKLIEIAVTNLEGSAENVLFRLRQLPLSDYTEIAQKVGEIVNGGF